MSKINLISITFLLIVTSCSTYKKTSVSLGEAVDKGKVKAVSSKGDITIFKNIELSDGNYYGLQGKSRILVNDISVPRVYLPNDQYSLSNNSIYFDGAGMLLNIGNAAHVMVNYERRIYTNETVSWYGRIGFGRVIRDKESDGKTIGFDSRGFLGAMTMLTGKGSSHFEFSAGLFVAFDPMGYGSLKHFVPSVDIGYRYQKPKGGFIFKAKAGNLGIGLGLGYAFRQMLK